MNNIVERLTTEYTISQCFHDVSRILYTIQEYERQLKSLSFQDEYLIDKYWETDGDFRDIDKLLEIYQAAQEHIAKLEAEGESCLFEKITTKVECPASQRGMFTWDDYKDGGAVEDSEAFSVTATTVMKVGTNTEKSLLLWSAMNQRTLNNLFRIFL